MLVIFNATTQSTYLAVRQARSFAEMGCDVSCVSLPLWFLPDRKGSRTDGKAGHVVESLTVFRALQEGSSGRTSPF